MLIFLTDRKLLGLELTRILSEAGLPVLMERPEAAEYLCRERTVGALLIDGIPNASAARALCNRMRAARVPCGNRASGSRRDRW